MFVILWILLYLLLGCLAAVVAPVLLLHYYFRRPSLYSLPFPNFSVGGLQSFDKIVSKPCFIEEQRGDYIIVVTQLGFSSLSSIIDVFTLSRDIMFDQLPKSGVICWVHLFLLLFLNETHFLLTSFSLGLVFSLENKGGVAV